MPNLTEKDNENVIRFAACLYAMSDQLWTLRDRIDKEPKYRLTILQQHAENLLKVIQAQMSPETKEIFETFSEYAHEVLNEAMKAENKPEFLAITKAYNEGKILIEN